MNIKVIQANNAEKIAQCHKIRLEVFVEEQKVPVEIEIDDLDEISIHALAYIDGIAVATGRLIPSEEKGKIGRMAVIRKYRRTGIGGEVLSFLEKKAKSIGISYISLHAQEYVKNFYLSHGYKQIGESFLEAEIDHIEMYKNL